jgi:GNAT superfamily N-acetyltransferase
MTPTDPPPDPAESEPSAPAAQGPGRDPGSARDWADVKIVRAGPKDAGELTAIAFRAKAHWGYPESWLRRWEKALTVSPDYVRDTPTFAAVRGSRVVGFFSLLVRGRDASLEHLWVFPPDMGKGVGSALFAAAEGVARSAGAARLKIESDPNAEAFYVRMGAVRCGSAPAAMDGNERCLPLLEKRL